MPDVTLLEQPTGTPAIIGAIASAPKVALAPIVITRPNNVTAYTIGDVYGPAADARIHVSNVGRLVGAMATLQGHLALNSAEATKPGFDFYVFSKQPETVIGDNAPFTGLSDNDVAAILGRFSFASGSWPAVAQQPQAGKTRTVVLQTFLSVGLLDVASRDLWMYAVLTNAYVPVALETLTLSLVASYQS